MEIDKRIYNGNRAKEVLENEAYLQAFTDIREEVTKEWENSPARDLEGRQNLWLMLKMLNKLQFTLQTTLETGKLAQMELTHKQSLAKRVKDAIFNG